MQKYTITLNEEQRNILVAALAAHAAKTAAVADTEEFDLMLGMLIAVPKHEFEAPNAIHDFTA